MHYCLMFNRKYLIVFHSCVKIVHLQSIDIASALLSTAEEKERERDVLNHRYPITLFDVRVALFHQNSNNI